MMNLLFIATCLLLTCYAMSPQHDEKIAVDTTNRLEDCARCGKNYRQYATCADFIGMKAIFISASPYKTAGTKATLSKKLESKMFAARAAGLTGQNNSTYCQSIPSLYYNMDTVLSVKCWGVCQCAFGKTVKARAKTAEAALAEGRSRCAAVQPERQSAERVAAVRNASTTSPIGFPRVTMWRR